VTPASGVGFATNTLGKILTIPQAAKLAGWSRHRMFRHLTRMNTELGNMLLANVSRGTKGTRWTVSVSALKLVHPQWFQDPESLQRQIEAVDEEVSELRLRLVRMEKKLDTLLAAGG
jgi:molybdenum-dependent DNA-binding transcriptional regulator ModE